MKNTAFAFAVAALLVSLTHGAHTQALAVPATAGLESSVDRLFAKWSAATPGCAVGVAVDGKPVLTKAYGLADLEHDVKNTADTIFEAGSVSKQFTAAAVLLLARDGKLSLDDPTRKYVPELPDYGTPLTIRHMLHHQSGLRDWGSVEGIAGWPRTTREYTHDHILDIVSRQKALNFKPGTQYSYSNTGFNLAAIIVARVSGVPFADFTAERLFKPLGMTHTSWRDDHTRIVKGRAVAYSAGRDGAFHTEMPFENVHGNGGLLTTVGDLLKWNENFEKPVVGDAALVRQQQEPGRFLDGHEGSYAFGLMVGDFRGLRKVDHSGSTAGYRAHLSRFPDARTSVAVLCNVSSGAATASANAVAELYLAGRLKPAPPPIEPDFEPPAILLPTTTLTEYAGDYWSDEAEVMFTLKVEKDQLVIKRRPATTIVLTPSSKDVFRGSIGGVTFIRDTSGRLKELSVRQDRVFDLRFQKR